MSVLKYSAVQYNGNGVDIENTLSIFKKNHETAADNVLNNGFEDESEEETYEPSREELLDEREKSIADKERELDELRSELNRLKEQYIEQGKQVIVEAKRRAEGIVKDAEANAADIVKNAEDEREGVFIKARAEGFEQGKKDGVAACMAAGSDILDEARNFTNSINVQKTELFERYESEIYETVMDIANKVTLDSMSVKDGTAAKKLIKKAAKNFRNSQLIRITLDENGASTELCGDYEYLKELCGGVEHIEVELVSGGETGTVIVDNGEEITDAGIRTQLQMIRELGDGKFRTPSLRKRGKGATRESEEEYENEYDDND